MYVAVDLGGTNTRVAAFQNLNTPSFALLARFATLPAYEDQLQRIFTIIRDANLGPLQGLGLAFGAQVGRDGQYVEASNMLADYIGKPIVRDLELGAGCSVRMANDSVCAVLAETRFGDLGQYERAAYMTVSTGTGGAFRYGLGDRQTVIFSQLGHQILHVDGDPCLCGQIGCLQTITGGRQILRRFGKPAAEVDDEAFWHEATDNLAIGIVNVSWITKIDAIVVGGAIALGNAIIQANLARRVSELRVGQPVFHVLKPRLDANSPLIGAAQLFAGQHILLH